MDLNVNLNLNPGLSAQVANLESRLMTTLNQHAEALTAVAAKVTKIGDETRTLLAKIGELQDAVAAAGNTTPEIDAAMEALTAQVAVVDDLVPDAGA